jgi:diadenosine tetraphosphatase ApaH/serine/threonine PP2A family protein phosphatase
VAGNHELLALGRLPTDRCGNLARLTLDWTRNALREDACRYLSALPVRAEAPGGVVLTHASLDDPQQYIRDPSEAAAQLDLLAAEHPLASTLIIGHTHRSWVCGRRAGTLPIPRDGQVRLQPGQPYLLNPGSVGQSRYRERVPRARCLLLDLDQGRATFYALAYDVESCRRELRRQGLPERSYHVPGSWRRSAAHRLRSLVRRTIARTSGSG